MHCAPSKPNVFGYRLKVGNTSLSRSACVTVIRALLLIHAISTTTFIYRKEEVGDGIPTTILNPPSNTDMSTGIWLENLLVGKVDIISTLGLPSLSLVAIVSIFVAYSLLQRTKARHVSESVK